MEIKQRDLVLISYPFSDFSGEKVRPAIVISNDRNNKSAEDVIVVPLTTNIRIKDYSFLLKQEDLESGKLIKDSRVKVDKIFSVKKDLIRMIIGRVKKEILDKISENLMDILR